MTLLIIILALKRLIAPEIKLTISCIPFKVPIKLLTAIEALMATEVNFSKPDKLGLLIASIADCKLLKPNAKLVTPETIFYI